MSKRAIPRKATRIAEEKPVKLEAETKPTLDVPDTLSLRTIVAELEADPLVPLMCEYPREYGEKILPRYRKLLAQLKSLT